MIPSLEGWPTKAKEAPSPHKVRLTPLDTNLVFQSLLFFISIHKKESLGISDIFNIVCTPSPPPLPSPLLFCWGRGLNHLPWNETKWNMKWMKWNKMKYILFNKICINRKGPFCWGRGLNHLPWNEMKWNMKWMKWNKMKYILFNKICINK